MNTQKITYVLALLLNLLVGVFHDEPPVDFNAELRTARQRHVVVYTHIYRKKIAALKERRRMPRYKAIVPKIIRMVRRK